MPETITPSTRIHRVTTRRQHLRELVCPLEPEVLVAEFANELPPNAALAVREHIAVCEICGARSRALREPYNMLASLGSEPVPVVPDLRDAVISHTRSRSLFRHARRIGAALGRGGTIGLTALLGLVALVALVAGLFVLPGRNTAAARSENGIAHPLAAGAGGLLYAETGKLVTVADSAGHTWKVAEVIAVDERNGTVTRSLPASSDSLTVAQTAQLPAAVQVNAQGTLLYELTAQQNGQQALLAFDATSGALKFATPLTPANGVVLKNGARAESLVLSPTGDTAYVGVGEPPTTASGPRALVVNAQTGQVERALTPSVPANVPMPPPPGSLPASAFPSTVPHLATTGTTRAEGAGGTLAISPDGQWLFDVMELTDTKGAQYALLRRIDVQTGQTAQALAVQGIPPNARLATNASTSEPQVYLVDGTPLVECLVFDASAAGPTEIGDIPLGGPVAPATLAVAESLSVSPDTSGTTLYVTQDAASADQSVVGHDVWVVDTQGMGLRYHRADLTNEGAVQSNPTGGAKGQIFLLQNGSVALMQPNLQNSSTQWLRLSDGKPVVALLGVRG